MIGAARCPLPAARCPLPAKAPVVQGVWVAGNFRLSVGQDAVLMAAASLDVR